MKDETTTETKQPDLLHEMGKTYPIFDPDKRPKSIPTPNEYNDYDRLIGEAACLFLVVIVYGGIISYFVWRLFFRYL